MADNTTDKNNLTGLILWISAGFLSWCLPTYIFSNLMLPVTFHITGYISENLPSLSQAVPALRVFIPHIPAYLLNFLFCMGLSMASRVTVVRVGGFMIAASGISLYYHVRQLAGYNVHHYGGDSSALNWIILGMISLAFISPLFAAMGSLIGNLIGNRIGKRAKERRCG